MLLRPGRLLSSPKDHKDTPGRKHLRTRAPPTATGSHTLAVESVNDSPAQGKEPETALWWPRGGDPDSPPPSQNTALVPFVYRADENKDEKEVGRPLPVWTASRAPYPRRRGGPLCA